MINRITDINGYEGYIQSFMSDPVFSVTSVSGLSLIERMQELLKKPDHVCYSVTDNNRITGMFAFIILENDRYAEMLLALSREANAVNEVLEYIKSNYAGYQFDFVFNPRDHLLATALRERETEFDTEQQKMVYDHTPVNVDVSDIELISPEYEQQYIEMHNTDVYWTAERVLQAQDTFRTYIALDGVNVAGYVDVTYNLKDNEPFDLYVKPQYRRLGYGRKLMARALMDNEPNGMLLTVDVDNLAAIRLYESLGFVKRENENTVTASWFI